MGILFRYGIDLVPSWARALPIVFIPLSRPFTQPFLFITLQMAGHMVYVTLYCRARKVVSDQRTSSTSSPPRALSSKLTCGLTNLDVAHWPSLENMADRRPRREYGTSRRAGSGAHIAGWTMRRRLQCRSRSRTARKTHACPCK